MRSDDRKFWPAPMAKQTDQMSVGATRMARVRESLKDLRRMKKADTRSSAAATPDGAADAEKGVAAAKPEEATERKDEEQDEALIYATLRDLNDTLDDLTSLEEQLKIGLDPVKENGGSRHATAIISARTLAVVQRKKHLLDAVTTRTVKMEALQEKFDELLVTLVSGEQDEAPAELKGIKKFVEKYTHSAGDPADANKSDFKGFVSTFRLPYWHSALSKLRSLMSSIGEWWADACLSEAEKGGTHHVLERLFDVAIGTGLDKQHPKLRAALKILNDRLADRVLREAKEFLERDVLLAERNKVPPVGPAGMAADAIEDSILKAIADGCPEGDKRLGDAKNIVKTLREADGSRKRMANREAKMQAQAKAAAEEAAKAEA